MERKGWYRCLSIIAAVFSPRRESRREASLVVVCSELALSQKLTPHAIPSPNNRIAGRKWWESWVPLLAPTDRRRAPRRALKPAPKRRWCRLTPADHQEPKKPCGELWVTQWSLSGMSFSKLMSCSLSFSFFSFYVSLCLVTCQRFSNLQSSFFSFAVQASQQNCRQNPRLAGRRRRIVSWKPSLNRKPGIIIESRKRKSQQENGR